MSLSVDLAGRVALVTGGAKGVGAGISQVLLEAGAAIKCTEVTVLNHKLKRLLDDPSRIVAMSRNARQLGRPGAAADVARIGLESEPRKPAVISKNREKI